MSSKLSTPLDLTKLSKCFTYTHEHTKYEVAWTRLGNPQGFPIVMLHGIPWNSGIWSRLALALASTNRYCVYLYDNPGYGQTIATSNDRNEEPDITPEAKAATFKAILEYWNLEQPPHVIAHDRGGQIALRGALVHGLKYASLCMIDVVATNPLGAPFLILMRDNPHVFKELEPAIFEGSVRAWVRTATANGDTILDERDEDMLVKPWIQRLGGAQGQEGFIRQAVQTHANLVEDMQSRYHELKDTLPVKIIWGDNDVWLPVERAKKLQSLLGAKELVVVQNAGHLILLEQPERIAVELTTWLAKVAS